MPRPGVKDERMWWVETMLIQSGWQYDAKAEQWVKLDDGEVRKPLYKVGDCVYAYFSSYWVDRVVVEKMFFDDNNMYVYYTKPTKASISLSLNTFAEDEIDLVANRVSSN
jgi:hypothetical protein